MNGCVNFFEKQVRVHVAARPCAKGAGRSFFGSRMLPRVEARRPPRTKIVARKQPTQPPAFLAWHAPGVVWEQLVHLAPGLSAQLAIRHQPQCELRRSRRRVPQPVLHNVHSSSIRTSLHRLPATRCPAHAKVATTELVRGHPAGEMWVPHVDVTLSRHVVNSYTVEKDDVTRRLRWVSISANVWGHSHQHREERANGVYE